MDKCCFYYSFIYDVYAISKYELINIVPVIFQGYHKAGFFNTTYIKSYFNNLFHENHMLLKEKITCCVLFYFIY